MTVLSELLHQSNVQGWSNREISVRAEKNGHKLSRASVDVYMGGRHGVPTEPVLAAFSDVLNIPIDKLRHAAGVPIGAGAPWTPPSEANRLDLRQRRALDELIRSMVASETLGEDQEHDDQEHDDDPHPPAGGLVEDPAQPDGITATDSRSWKRDEYGLAAMTGTSDLDRLDREAAERGEGSQDPGGDEPA